MNGKKQLDRFVESSIDKPHADPPVTRMPRNDNVTTVKKALDDFLLDSNEPFIITGYTSLKQLVSFISAISNTPRIEFCLLLGNEPSLSTPNSYKPSHQNYPEEVEAYWLDKGFSLRQSLDLANTLKMFDKGRVNVQYLNIPNRMLHAKIYLAEDYAVLGSSNFSLNGLTKNIEGNVKFHREDDEVRYTDIRHFAENLWEDQRAVDYTDTLYELLKKLLRTTTWKESLARACAELLEGHWADQYMENTSTIEQTTIWPAQRAGVTQALCILDQVGSVLLADATGSGKTRLGSILLRALHDRVWKKGKARKSSYTTLVCPPGVRRNWSEESMLQGLQITPFSQNTLSQKEDKESTYLLKLALKRTQILCVDEAHNYLNDISNRTKFLLRNMADHVILQTATPINRGQSDLLSLINILGADNFDPNIIRSFNQYLKKDKGTSDQADETIKSIKKEIGRFTVRRTKAQFNTLIDLAPEAYRDIGGRLCRYPIHEALSYSTGETNTAIALAEEVRALASKLKGIAYFEKKVSTPNNLKEKYSEQDIVDWRLSMARSGARYNIMSHLRSSKCAALAHIQGNTNGKSKHQGMLDKLKSIEGQPPGCSFELDNIEIPKWLYDEEAHRVVAKEEASIYLQLCNLLESMDDSRENTKSMKLIELVRNHKHSAVLAFDHHPISLDVFREKIEQYDPEIEVIVATGGDKKKKEKLEDLLKPRVVAEKRTKPLIVLCSDAMSEGLNFQTASALVNLDMPSVVRLLEQRVGRIDRLNSPHECIEVYWPEDSKAFALRSDDKLIERHGRVEYLLGSNVPLPEIHKKAEATFESYQDIIEEYARHTDNWNELDDAFTPIRSLIGKDGLINDGLYQRVSKHDIDIKVRLTIIDEPEPWVFFCIRGSDFSAPKWVYFERRKEGFITDFDEIAKILVTKLRGRPEQSELIDKETQDLLDEYLKQVECMERYLLPKRKQVALTEMEHVLKAYLDQVDMDEQDHKFVNDINEILTSSSPDQNMSIDWGTLADNWLDVIRPYWYEELESERRKKAILLKDIRERLIHNPIPVQTLRAAFPQIPLIADSIEKRIVACIVSKATL